MVGVAENLPVRCGESILVLLVQSPRVLFAYWEVSAASQEFLKGKEMVLRLSVPVDGRFLPREVVSPSFYAGNWYFRGVAPGERYRCELGWLEDGRFYPLLYSEVVETPPDKAMVGLLAIEKQGQEKEPVAFVEAVRVIGLSSGIFQEK